MYRILGADGKEYGPASEEVVRQWIAQGRANPRTQIRREGSSEWVSVGTLPEFAEALAGPTAAPAMAAPGFPVQAKTSGLAISSLVLGVLGFCGITALVGLILGIVALGRINRSGGRLSGNGLAIGGICVSGFMLLFSVPVMAALLLPALARAKQRAQTISCMNNVRQLTLALVMYADANGGKLPPAGAWCDAISAKVGSPNVFKCLAAGQGGRCSYGFNQRLNGFPVARINDRAQTVLVFEADGGWNMSGAQDEILRQPRHARGVVIGFADGHAELVSTARLPQLIWEP